MKDFESIKKAFDDGKISEDDFLIFLQVRDSFLKIRNGYSLGLVDNKKYVKAAKKYSQMQFEKKKDGNFKLKIAQ